MTNADRELLGPYVAERSMDEWLVMNDAADCPFDAQPEGGGKVRITWGEPLDYIVVTPDQAQQFRARLAAAIKALP